MSLGQGTQVVDGQRNLFPTSFAYNPSSYGAQTTGLPQVSPTMPPFIGAANGGGSALAQGAGAEGVGGYGTAGNNSTAAATANAHPHNLKVSPVWWAIGSLVIGLVLLNAVHWRKTTLESFDAHGNVGAARADAGESV